MRLSFCKNERVCNNEEFLKTRKHGKRYFTPNLTLYVMPSGKGLKRLGIIVTKKFGNAPKRNRIKRLLRESFRLNKTAFPQSSDIIIAVKKDATFKNRKAVEDELLKIKW